MTELAVRPTSELSIRVDQVNWTDKQRAALQQLGVKDATNADLAVFFHQAVRTGLDPFAKQIYMIGRWSQEGTKQTIQTGIDGYRLIARRAADRGHETLAYADTLWCGKDGDWRDAWLADEPPAAAKVVVLRNGQPFPAVALWNEYVQTTRDGKPNSMWGRMGANQLAKCAEALALRKAFPQDLAGIYTEDEMGQADRAPDGAHVITSAPEPRVTADEITRQSGQAAGGPKATQGQLARIHALLHDHGVESDDGVRQAIGEILQKPPASRTALTKDDAATVLDHLEKLGSPAGSPAGDDPSAGEPS